VPSTPRDGQTSKQIDAANSKPSILIVDDETRIRQVCVQMLSHEGYDVAQAENGEKGLEAIADRHFDIILLDLCMPGISGMEALGQIRSLHPDTVVIVITGYATLSHAVEAMKNGAFDFLAKPFSPEDLRLIIGKAFEHIRTLNDIAHEKSRMHAMLNQLADGVLATDARKKIALANQAFLSLIRHDGSPPIGMDCATVLRDETLESMIDQALALTADSYTEITKELRIPSDEMQERVLAARCVPFRDRLGRTLGTITVLHDITALKKIDQMKSDFVSMVSHEIRSPLSSIQMQLKVILDRLAGDVSEKQNEILLRASEKIQSLVALSTELLDLSKMESGLINLEKQNLQLLHVIRDQVAFQQGKAQAKNITLEMVDIDDLPEVLANKMNMEEVIANLITNAIRYTPEGGKIVVAAGQEGDYVRISVSDNGLGIAPEDVGRIFNRFYRVKNEKTRQIIGTGLGLPIVKSIVEAHHGRIQVDSQVDVGSTFTVFIPVIGDRVAQ
jgi:signal transduction histidine kinase/FixJ family two-component response regulator